MQETVRNIAIIAHVDHGKTTLVDAMLMQSGIFRENQQVTERIMDSNDLERERGITILSKNLSIRHGGMKINIVDTPGHADFGGEVERVLKMVDSVLLLVDAFDGPMPQTRFVLKKSLDLGLRPIVVINKIDRPGARPDQVVDMVFDLFCELNASDEQLDFPIVYTSAKLGIAKKDLDDESDSLEPLFEVIRNRVPAPDVDPDAPFQLLVTSIAYNDYIGRLATGKIFAGRISAGETVAVIGKDGTIRNGRISKLLGYDGLQQVELTVAEAGDIVTIAGFEEIGIGETVADAEHPIALPYVAIDEPTLSMNFIVNNSPFAGQEGKFVTSRNLRERLLRELRTNVSLRVEETEQTDTFKVSGRGELHLSILIENMRREGYELSVSKPEVILREIDGVKCEPLEYLTIDVPEEYQGTVIEKLGVRKAEMVSMTPMDGFTRLEFIIPARGLIGFRTEFLTDTHGTGIMNHTFHDYGPWRGPIPGRKNGVLIAMEACETVAYGLFNLQERGILFVGPGVKVYEGMIIGQHAKENDLVVNPGKGKKLTNIRAAGSDEAVRLTPPRTLSLEQALEFIDDDELVEVTPKSIRLRKKVLNANERKKLEKQKKAGA
ncbi:GTP-binding protein [Geothermobacter ehrlichii]|uniref:Large ribosomal subunit assembly factor BipA n=1 Tax=Geothermobacter ehrlichii TaxID=213224 RepID=A0A5D3WLK9_9BACT|nr:translational GTPase TypA [Geothermobacter ehrlichii]TYO99992.1 GTP-binding protein [Geothermobacter ehrlichii]